LHFPLLEANQYINTHSVRSDLRSRCDLDRIGATITATGMWTNVRAQPEHAPGGAPLASEELERVVMNSSLFSSRSLWSILSFASVLSVASSASLLSVGSFASILSIGSSGSVLSIGSSGAFLGIGTAGRRKRIGQGVAA
jgi:hypothetical protein